MRGSHGLTARRARRTLSSRAEGPKGPQPRLLVINNTVKATTPCYVYMWCLDDLGVVAIAMFLRMRILGAHLGGSYWLRSRWHQSPVWWYLPQRRTPGHCWNCHSWQTLRALWYLPQRSIWNVEWHIRKTTLEKHDHPKTNLAGEVSSLLKAFEGKVLEQLLLDALPLGLRQRRGWNLVQEGNVAEALVVVTAAVPLRLSKI